MRLIPIDLSAFDSVTSAVIGRRELWCYYNRRDWEEDEVLSDPQAPPHTSRAKKLRQQIRRTPHEDPLSLLQGQAGNPKAKLGASFPRFIDRLKFQVGGMNLCVGFRLNMPARQSKPGQENALESER
jgi:hypothetical protein